MLKALELTGFKSFADKTRFEFPPGITVVVGPNGSGKSNIVDAIKWVLGEQSAKSLRGKEMTDVIFKGSSGVNARKPANAATATIVLDNSQKSFDFEANEVHVSRRVYRNGDSEYLINGEPTRLKDIKSLFRGTGVGTDAYSLIEQGKVERLLQANPKDRRAIFEEAAGISRFKAQKIEAERRLARVEGNLIRLADIVEEVGKRYRSVKAQASKAARYRECSQRLQFLRTHRGWVDWNDLGEQLSELTTQVDQHESERSGLKSSIAQISHQSLQLEQELEQVNQLLNQRQESTGQIREQIAQTESQINLHQSRSNDLKQRQQQLVDQHSRITQRVAELKQLISDTRSETTKATARHQQSEIRLKELQTEIAAIDRHIEEWTLQRQQYDLKKTEQSRSITELNRNLVSIESRIENQLSIEETLQTAIEQLQAQRQVEQRQLDLIEIECRKLQQQAETVDSKLAQAQQRSDSLNQQLQTALNHAQQINTELITASQRADVLDELERSLEGINTGARDLLKMAANDSQAGSQSEVIGLVADLIAVNIQHAAIVDVALGDFAQYVVVDGQQIVQAIATERIKLQGRVGVIQLSQPPTLGADPHVSLNGIDGVIGRADRLVQVQPEYQSFVRQLLGGTWVVKSLSGAIQIHASIDSTCKVRLVTLDGEVIEADGTLVAGPKSLSLGLVSRRSELRALKKEIVKLQQESDQVNQHIKQLKADLKQSDLLVQQRIGENRQLATELAERKSKIQAVEISFRQIKKQLDQSMGEVGRAKKIQQESVQQQNQVRQSLGTQEQNVTQMAKQIEEIDNRVVQSKQHRTELEEQSTSARVDLAKAEQQLESWHREVPQLQSEFDKQQSALSDIQQQQDVDQQAIEISQAHFQSLSETLEALLESRKQAIAELASATENRAGFERQRRELNQQLSAQREQLSSIDEGLHHARLQQEQIEMQRSQLAERLHDDYGIDIKKVSQAPQGELDQPQNEAESEIKRLKKQLTEIGSVNLDALEELEELEGRYLSMDAQYQDLVEAKETLRKIIQRIDADSRKLFVETLEAIRQNFQKLFRQTFGGGQADILLEEGVDPLEAGVEIVATPPGKSQFSNSLLSGGEKALTAVSLLMAIFQFRPSPFCVLDEVDAPFDEANIGRFIDVLKSFLGWTRFVIVTHSKKTMTAATTLYGITMQESGVSRRVSVRFEDVSDDGEISAEAAHQAEEDAA